MGDERTRIFLISQVGDKGTDIRKRADNIHNHVVSPVAGEFGLDVLRSDRDPTPGPVTSQILRSILDSRVVVADLTGRNPNVYYELGIVHSFGLPVVIMVDKVSSLSFDVKNERVIEIGDDGRIDVDQAEHVKQELKAFLEVVLAEGYKPSSLVTETARVQRLEELAPEDAEASELTDIKQRLDQMISAIRRIPRVSRSAADRELSIDLGRLTRAVATLVREGRMNRSEIESLIDDHTSEDFDAWVNRLLAYVPEDSSSRDTVLKEEDFDDIPF